MTDEPLVVVEDLEKHYPITEGLLQREVGRVRAVDGISFTVRRGETVGLIGESGCGKSTAAASLLRIEEPTGGTVRVDGTELGLLSAAELRAFRRRASMVFQDPTESFDPRMTIGESVGEPLRVHGLDEKPRRETVVRDLLERVRLDPETAERAPGELSGGQKQRAALARALALNPDLLVLDEPVSALDVSVQAEIIELLRDLQTELGLAVLLITHDTGVVRELCDRVNVMYVGEIVERGRTDPLFGDPKHPYTRALVESVPTPDPRAERTVPDLRGEVPDAESPPPGCRFHPRCPSVIQPEGVDMEQDAYRGVVALRRALADGALDKETAVKLTDGAGDDAPVAATVRAQFGIPSELTDAAAERAVSGALETLLSGDPEAAHERLESLASVCETEPPELRQTADDRPVACHLFTDGGSGPTRSADADPTDGSDDR